MASSSINSINFSFNRPLGNAIVLLSEDIFKSNLFKGSSEEEDSIINGFFFKVLDFFEDDEEDDSIINFLFFLVGIIYKLYYFLREKKV